MILSCSSADVCRAMRLLLPIRLHCVGVCLPLPLTSLCLASLREAAHKHASHDHAAMGGRDAKQWMLCMVHKHV